MCAVWFPYTLLDRLQSCLSTSSDLAIREKLQDSLKCALQSHFKQVRFFFMGHFSCGLSCLILQVAKYEMG